MLHFSGKCGNQELAAVESQSFLSIRAGNSMMLARRSVNSSLLSTNLA
jgi:hypothetical protein